MTASRDTTAAGGGSAGRLDVVEVPTVAGPSFVVQPLALVVIGALPGFVLRDVIADGAPVTVAAAVAVAAGGTAVGVARLAPLTRRPSIPLAVLVVGAAVSTAVVTLLWTDGTGRGPAGALVDAIVHGWATIVTSATPAPAEPRLLVPVTLTVWAAVAAGVTLSIGTTARVVPLLPGAAALLLSSIAAGGHQATPIASGLAFVAAAAVVLVVRNPKPSGRLRSARARRSAATAVAFTVVTAATAWLAGPALAGGRADQPFDPRDHVTPPHVPAAADNPLDLVARRLRRGDDVMFTTRWTGDPQSTRLAVLDVFDGAGWSVSGSWVRAGAALPDPERGLATDVVTAAVTIDQLAGPWLPSFGDRPAVSGVAAIVHLESGALAMTGGETAGASFSVTADVPDFENTALAAATVARDDEARAALVVADGVPDGLHQVLDAAVANVTAAAPPFVLASSLEAYFQANYGIDPDSRPGHSYGRLVEAFTQDLIATDEQFATGFAVLGRLLGLPTRVVVGFGPGTETSPGTYTVLAGDVEVWPEVRFDGFGWVPFHPAPSATDAAESNSPMELDGQQIQVVVNDPPPPPPPAVEPPPDVAGDGSWTDRLLGLAVVGIPVVAGLAIVGTTVLVVLKRRQTARRRRAGDPRQRVLGAWHDVLDRLVEDGTERPSGHTVEEHVERAERVSASLTGLYRPVTRALYGHADVDDDDAHQAWRCRDRFVRAMRGEATMRRRCRRAIDPRSLLHTVIPATTRLEERR